MSRHFRPWTIDQTQLLPAAVVDYVPADHLAQFVVALAREHLDLSEIVASYKSGLGQPPFDPRMMTALLLYAYCSGLYSSRRIAKACAERVDFMMIVAHDAPDFRIHNTIRARRVALFLLITPVEIDPRSGTVRLCDFLAGDRAARLLSLIVPGRAVSGSAALDMSAIRQHDPRIRPPSACRRHSDICLLFGRQLWVLPDLALATPGAMRTT